jgi:hypothetical protein
VPPKAQQPLSRPSRNTPKHARIPICAWRRPRGQDTTQHANEQYSPYLHGLVQQHTRATGTASRGQSTATPFLSKQRSESQDLRSASEASTAVVPRSLYVVSSPAGQRDRPAELARLAGGQGHLAHALAETLLADSWHKCGVCSRGLKQHTQVVLTLTHRPGGRLAPGARESPQRANQQPTR